MALPDSVAAALARCQALESRYRKERVRSRPAWPPPESEIQGIVEDLLLVAEWYPTGAARERESIRADLASTDFVLRGPLQRAMSVASQRFGKTKDSRWLDVLLALVSIEDQRMDFRDTLMLLGAVYVRAVEAGIDPLPHLERAATLSSPQTSHMLEGFTRSAFFAESVRPRIAALRRLTDG